MYELVTNPTRTELIKNFAAHLCSQHLQSTDKTEYVAELAEKLEMLVLLNLAPFGLIYIHMSEGCCAVTIMLMHAKFCTCSSHCLGGWPPFNDLGLSRLSRQ